MCEVGTRPPLPAGDRGGGETPPASALSPPGCVAGDKCREMGEQPIFTTRAHVFQIDHTTKKNWVPASKQAVTVSYFYDSTRNSYRIISVDGTKKPEAFLLGIVGQKVSKKDRNFFMYATTAARILIAKYWKTQDLPTLEEWQTQLMDYMELAEMTGRIRDFGEETTEEDWKKFKDYLQKQYKLYEC